MKKFFVWSLVAAAGLFSVACSENGKTDGPGTESKDVIMNPPTHGLGGYYKQMLADDSNCYMVALSDVAFTGTAGDPIFEEMAELVILMLYAPAVDGKDDVLPEGTYKMVAGSTSVVAGTCHGEQSVYATTNASGKPLGSSYFKPGGKVVVTHEGTGYKIELTGRLSNDKNFKMTFNGEIPFSQYFVKYSTLQEDYVATVKDNTCRLTYGGTIKDPNDANAEEFDFWSVEILRFSSSGIPADGSEGFVSQVMSPRSGFAAGLAEGDYAVIDRYAEFTALPGYTNTSLDMFMTWYIGNFSMGQAKAMAPARGGKVTVTKDGDNYTISFVDCIDDNRETPHKFSGTWTGKPTLVDATKK